MATGVNKLNDESCCEEKKILIQGKLQLPGSAFILSTPFYYNVDKKITRCPNVLLDCLIVEYVFFVQST